MSIHLFLKAIKYIGYLPLFPRFAKAYIDLLADSERDMIDQPFGQNPDIRLSVVLRVVAADVTQRLSARGRAPVMYTSREIDIPVGSCGSC